MKEYKITVGDLLVQTRIDEMSGFITMRDPVDRELLEQAVNRTAACLPFLATELIKHEDGSWYLRENGLPYIVVEAEKPLPIGSPEANYHEFSYSCWGNTIHFVYNHLICDGHGYAMISGLIMQGYCELRYGLEPKVSLEDMAAKINIDDPFSYIKAPAQAIPPLDPPVLFRFPPEDLLTDGSFRAIRFMIPKEELMTFVKAHQGSPAVLFSLLLCRAADSIYPNQERDFVVQTAVDIRRILGCPGTVQNCLGAAGFPYSKALRDLPLGEQLRLLREILKQQMEPDYVMQRTTEYAMLYEQMLKLRQTGTLPPKFMYDLLSPMVVSYVGEIKRGALDEYCGKLTVSSDSANAVTLGINEEQGAFHVFFRHTLSSDALLEAYFRELEEIGLPYEVN